MSKKLVPLFALFLIATVSGLATLASAQAKGESLSSWPPDTSSHSRPAIAEDTSTARSMVRSAAGEATILVDVNSVNFKDGSEPSIAVSETNPNLIVVNGGFGGWGEEGTSDVNMFVSTNGGVTWSLDPIVSPPTGITGGLANCPCDTTIDFGLASVFSGTFLGGATDGGSDDGANRRAIPAAAASPNSVYSGTSNNLSAASNWGWFLTNGVTQKTNSLVADSNPDQPWLRVNRDPITSSQQNVYVAYDDFSSSPVGMKVAVATGTNPPNFVRDESAGISSGSINPGQRLAVDPGTGWIYDLFQHCPGDAPGCTSSDGEKTISYFLNRSTDGGLTWGLNGDAKGVVVATAPSTQPRPKFGTVNALLGGIDHVAVDPNNGDVYVVYGDQSSGHQLIMIRRLINDAKGNLTIGDAHAVSVAGMDSALPSVAVAGGAVGVLYTAFHGFPTPSVGPLFSAHLATSTDQGATFSDQTLLVFVSPASDNNKPRQRVLGDYQQLRAIGSTFYGVFTGNGAALGRDRASSDPIFVSAAGAPTAAPSPAAQATAATAVRNKGKAGQTVAGGDITLVNNSNVTETVTAATIKVSRPSLFSSMTLSGGGQSQTITSLGASTTFTFASPIGVPSGGAVKLSLSTVIADHSAMADSKIKFAGLIAGASLPENTRGWPLAASLLLLGTALLGLPGTLRRRAIIGSILAVGLLTASSGCGGGSSGAPPAASSSQKVTAITVMGGGAQAPVAGLPQSLGKISK